MALDKKYDIFISYRHNNMTLVGELVHKLEMYYDVFWDQRLESGYWNEQLKNAIKNSRAVLINLTFNSLSKNLNGEDWFYNEIVYSMENKSKEQIIPICYDGFSFPDELEIEGITENEKEKLKNLREKHQHIEDKKTLDEIIESVIIYLSGLGIEPKTEYSHVKNVYSIKYENIAPVRSFIGRDSELSDIIELIQKNNMVFLSGIGGIGKTELAKKFMEQMTGEYRCIFCKYETSLKNTLSKIEINGLDTEDFNVRERVLQKLLNKNIILVIDNFDFKDEERIDDYIHEFCKYPCKKLITTRNAFSEMEFPVRTGFFSLDSLNKAEIKELFEAKYGKKITDEQFERILGFTGGLTLVIPILASLCHKSDMTIDELCTKLSDGIRGLENTESIRYIKDGNQKGNIPEIIRVLFDLDKISDGKKKTLCNLSILQFMPVTKRMYKELAFSDGNGNLDDFNELEEDCWIKTSSFSDDESTYYELHPLINALIAEDLKPSASSCPEIFRALEQKADTLFKTKSPESVWISLINSLDLNNKSNYNYVSSRERRIIESDFDKNGGIHSSVTLNAVWKKIREILLSRSLFDEDDVILAAGLMGIKEVADDMEFVSFLADKCFESAQNSLTPTDSISIFTKKFVRSAVYEMNLLSSNRAIACRTYSVYEKDCRKYLSLKSGRAFAKSLRNVKKFLETKVKKYGDIYKCAEDARNAGNIEKSFCYAEQFWRVMDIKEFFRENVFMVYLKETSSKEDTEAIINAMFDRYAGRDMSDEYGFDFKYEISEAFMHTYVIRGLHHLTYEQCYDLITRLERYNDFPRHLELTAKLMCGDDELIEKELYELISADKIKHYSPENAHKPFYDVSSAVSLYYGLHGLDRYAEDIFIYLDELKELSVQNNDFAKAVLTAHEKSVGWFKGIEYIEKAQKKYDNYKEYAKKLGLPEAGE